jgi:predicted amidohydrolase YtcJ
LKSALPLALGGTGIWASTGRAQEAPREGGPEWIIVNAVVYTVEEKMPRAEALAIQHGRFIAVGSSSAVRSLAGRGTQVLDAQGMTIVPGFIDAHTHPASAGVRELLDVACDRDSIADIVAAIRVRVAQTAEGEWVFGFKYDDTKLKEERPLNRHDLDAVSPRHPVRITHRGGHTAVYNSLALRMAKIDRNTPDPEGGKFVRDDKGELTGLAQETAVERVVRVPTPTPRQGQAGVKRISELMTAAGLTSVHDAGTSPAHFAAYRDALAAGEMLFRVYTMVQPELFQRLNAAGIRSGFGDDRLRVGGLKLFCDGSASERTMRMSTPYVGRPNDFGILVTTQDKLDEQVRAAHDAGWQVGVHANGDVAIDMVLRSYELAQRATPRTDTRHRIEHCTLVNESLLKRIKAAGVIPAPFYTYVYYHGDKWAQYGEEKTRWMFAHRSFLDHGIAVVGASDYVPGPFQPLMAIQSMVTRKDYRGRVWGGNQRITVAEALKICTLNGAHASFEERAKGSIAPGKLADFVLLADDPHKVDPERIKDIAVVRTVVGGRTVYQRA